LERHLTSERQYSDKVLRCHAVIKPWSGPRQHGVRGEYR